MKQLNLPRSPRYEPFISHLVNDLKWKREQAEEYAARFPRLFDPNYLGHDENGNPCKSLSKGD